MRPDEIASAVRRAVLERVIRPGQVLNQEELAKWFGVSRIPLREALRTLVGEGLIIIKPGLGAIVTELDLAAVEELYGLRLRLEPPLAADIVEQLQPADISELSRMSERLVDVMDERGEAWSSTAYAFNRRLYEVSARRHTVRLVVQVLNLVEPYARMHAQIPGARDRTTEVAGALVRALEARNQVKVQRRIQEGIESTRSLLVTAMASVTTHDDQPPSGDSGR
jgi:DNA-binding GntR family transcriptional regulator